jgi:hypothetical protein
MTDFFIFIYALLTIFVVQAMQRNHRDQRPNPQMVTMVGWGLFSLSSTLAILLGAVNMPLPDTFSAPIF